METILLIEDEPSISELWTRTLEDAGYRVVTAADAMEAARLLADHTPAVAIYDVHIPGASGPWLPELIRRQHRTTAIVVATADGLLPPQDTMRSPIVAYLVKPVGRDELLAAVAAAVAWSARQTQRLSNP